MGLFKRAIFVTGLKMCNAGLGFIVGILLAIVLGANETTDALFVAMFIPFNVGLELPRIAGIALLPSLAEEEVNGQYGVFPAFMGWWLVFLSGLFLLVIMFAPWIVRVLAPGLSPEGAALARNLLLILSPSLVFMGLFGTTQTLFYHERRFYEPELARAFWRIVALGALVTLGKTWGVTGYAVGLSVASFIQFILPLPIAKKLGIKVFHLTKPSWNVAPLHNVIRGGCVGVIAMLFDRGTMGVDRFFTSFLGAGSISILSYAERLGKTLPILLASSFLTLFLPELSSARARKENISRVGNDMLLFLISLGLPLGIFTFWAAKDIVNLVLVHGNFNPELALPAAYTIMAFSLGIPANLCSVGLKGLYFVDANVKMVVRICTLDFAINTIADLVLVRWGVKGIALASSIRLWLVLAYMWKYSGIGFPKWQEYGRLLSGCALMAGLLFIISWNRMVIPSTLMIPLGLVVALSCFAVFFYPEFKKMGQVIRVATDK